MQCLEKVCTYLSTTSPKLWNEVRQVPPFVHHFAVVQVFGTFIRVFLISKGAWPTFDWIFVCERNTRSRLDYIFDTATDDVNENPNVYYSPCQNESLELHWVHMEYWSNSLSKSFVSLRCINSSSYFNFQFHGLKLKGFAYLSCIFRRSFW